jgi:integrase/recombinase XerD
VALRDYSTPYLNQSARTKAYLEPSEVEGLEKHATNLRDRLLIRLLFHLGCRVSEALALQVQDIDFNQGIVVIQHLKCHIKLSCQMCGARLGATHVFCPKCGGKIGKSRAEEQQHRRQRILPADSHTLDILNEYIERGGPVVRDGKRLIFGINRHRAWQIVKECAEEAGLPKLVNPETGKIHNVSPHKLRDAFSIMAIKQNGSGDGLRLLQEHLGHQSFNTTARYRKISGTEHQEWYRKLWSKKE